MSGWDPLSTALLFSTLLLAVLTGFVWRERPKAGATAMTVEVFALALWTAGQFVVSTAGPASVRLLGYSATLAGTALVPAAWLVFAKQYVGDGEWVTRRRLALLSVEPLAVTGLALTNGVHGLVWVDFAVEPVAGGSALTYQWGPAFLAHVGYAYAVALVANYVLAGKFVASRNVYRTRTFIFIAMSLTVMAASALSVLRLSPLPHMTLVPVLYLGIGLLSIAMVSGNWLVSTLPFGRLFGLFRARSKNLAPAGRDTAIEELQVGFIVVDHENRIVDINHMGRLMLGQKGTRIVGKRLDDVIPSSAFVEDGPPLLDPAVTGEFTGVWVHTGDGEARCYDLTITALGDDEDAAGRVGLLHDVTDRERRKQQLEAQNDELERQNEQLENFANIVSHDLRNPLNVAGARLQLVDAGDDQEHVAEARRALDRIEDIIHDVLTMARLGQTVDDTEAVDLAAVADDAWANVDAADATLVVEVTGTVEASRGRLLQVFENLYRNAVEHAGPDVTVTVGPLADGFFVADDGSGLPEDRRDEVFTEGFTTEDDGTGFGLAIVRTIAEAHGWTVTATTDDDRGGARFEFTGVETDREQGLPSTAD